MKSSGLAVVSFAIATYGLAVYEWCLGYLLTIVRISQWISVWEPSHLQDHFIESKLLYITIPYDHHAALVLSVCCGETFDRPSVIQLVQYIMSS